MGPTAVCMNDVQILAICLFCIVAGSVCGYVAGKSDAYRSIDLFRRRGR